MSAKWTADRGLVADIERQLAEPTYFRDVLAMARSRPYRDVLRAWADVRGRLALDRDELGRYWIKR